MKVLILFTRPPERVKPDRLTSEFDLSEAAAGVAHALPGAEVVGVRGSAPEVLEVLDAHRPEVVFNLCEAPLGRPDLESHAASVFEWHGIPFTGSGSDTLALCRRKDRTKAVLAAAGVPVPRSTGFPCIVKPADEDGSTGIDTDSVCADADAVARARARIADPVVIEEFLPGKEFAVSLWGGTEPEHVSIGDLRFQNGQRLFTYKAKWDETSADYKNAVLYYHTELDPPLRAKLTTTAQGAWRAVGARGYIRVDLRLDAVGIPRVMDVNPNPDVTPDLGLYRAVEEAGWSWERFVRSQVEWATPPSPIG